MTVHAALDGRRSRKGLRKSSTCYQQTRFAPLLPIRPITCGLPTMRPEIATFTSAEQGSILIWFGALDTTLMFLSVLIVFERPVFYRSPVSSSKERPIKRHSILWLWRLL